MTVGFADKLPGAADKGSIRIWLKSSAYTKRVLLGPGVDPWASGAHYLAYFSQAQGLLKPDVAVLEVGDLYDAWNAAHGDLTAAMGITPPSLYTANHYQAGAKYYTQTHHLIIPEIFVMSRISWDKLGKDDQALVKKFAREAQLEQRVLWDKSVADTTAKLKAAGVEFIAIDTKPFYDATAPVRAKYGAQNAELIKRIEAVK